MKIFRTNMYKKKYSKNKLKERKKILKEQMTIKEEN